MAARLARIYEASRQGCMLPLRLTPKECQDGGKSSPSFNCPYIVRGVLPCGTTAELCDPVSCTQILTNRFRLKFLNFPPEAATPFANYPVHFSPSRTSLSRCLLRPSVWLNLPVFTFSLYYESWTSARPPRLARWQAALVSAPAAQLPQARPLAPPGSAPPPVSPPPTSAAAGPPYCSVTLNAPPAQAASPQLPPPQAVAHVTFALTRRAGDTGGAPSLSIFPSWLSSETRTAGARAGGPRASAALPPSGRATWTRVEGAEARCRELCTLLQRLRALAPAQTADAATSLLHPNALPPSSPVPTPAGSLIALRKTLQLNSSNSNPLAQPALLPCRSHSRRHQPRSPHFQPRCPSVPTAAGPPAAAARRAAPAVSRAALFRVLHRQVLYLVANLSAERRIIIEDGSTPLSASSQSSIRGGAATWPPVAPSVQARRVSTTPARALLPAQIPVASAQVPCLAPAREPLTALQAPPDAVPLLQPWTGWPASALAPATGARRPIPPLPAGSPAAPPCPPGSAARAHCSTHACSYAASRRAQAYLHSSSRAPHLRPQCAAHPRQALLLGPCPQGRACLPNHLLMAFPPLRALQPLQRYTRASRRR
ncbi:hypothetical protein Efla_000145 [Eimeria flavescens]